jgi:hypothetical protein
MYPLLAVVLYRPIHVCVPIKACLTVFILFRLQSPVVRRCAYKEEHVFDLAFPP